MTELDDAIFAHFNTTNSLNTALGGRLFPGFAGDGETFPYATYNEVPGEKDYGFGEEVEAVGIQISLYSEESSPQEINTLYGYLDTLFNKATLNITGWDFLWCIEDDRVRVPDVTQGTWAYHVTYSILLER